MLKYFPSPPITRSIVSLKSKFTSRQSSSSISKPSISITVGGLKIKDVRKDEIIISLSPEDISSKAVLASS